MYFHKKLTQKMYSFRGQNVFKIMCVKHFRKRSVFNHKAKRKMHTIKCTCSK